MASGSYANLLRWIVFVFNFLFWIAGVVVLGISVWLLFDRGVAQHMMEIDNRLHDFYVAVYLLLAVGIVMSLLGFIGFCGALRMSKCLLTSFFILLVAIFCAELTCGVLAYAHQEQVRQYIEKSMYNTVINQYGIIPSYTRIFDSIQSGLQCCGVKSYKDWLVSYYANHMKAVPEVGIGNTGIGRVPLSCCNALGMQEHENNCGITFDKMPLFWYEVHLNTQGCLDTVYGMFYQNLDVVIGLAVGIGCFQLVGMVFTMLLCCWIDHKKKENYKSGSY